VSLVAALIAACAPKVAPIVANAPPRFPDFLFPAVPPEFANTRTGTYHANAWVYLQAGDLRNAERNFSTALKETPGFYPAEAGLGYVELAGRRYGEALARFDRALGASAAYVPALVGKGEALLGANQDREALETFEAALAADPSLAPVRRRIEVLQFRGLQEHVESARKAAAAGRPAEAREAYLRAIAASPESAFLHRELALLERSQGDMAGALEHGRRAAELDPGDARALVLVAEVYEMRGELEAAARAYEQAMAIEPSETVTARLEAVRETLALARLPEQYRAISGAPSVSRGELAALLGVRLERFLNASTQRAAVVITDTRNHWAAPWIMSVAASGVLEVYDNHTFQPEAPVRRGDLAQAVSRVLMLVATRDPALAQDWQRPVAFKDVGTGHLGYPAAARSVAAGVLPLLDGDTFQLSRPVSGPEATAAVERLEALVGKARPSAWRAPGSSPP
jgi:tetratricopeptide (TPR) repeat protein